ncbi:MAG: TonB family protein [Acidobacteria bacterium]|nr:TonB family protein [Acidobacteriota bacterium]
MKAFMIFIAFCSLFVTSTLAFNTEYVTEEFLLDRVIEKGELQYPDIGKPKIPGRVILSVVINENGIVEKTNIIAGHSFLNESAVNYINTWKFLPLTDNENTYKMSGIITVWFDFASNNPIRGQHLAPIRVLGIDTFIVDGRNMNYPQLENWIRSKTECVSCVILQLQVRDTPSEEFFKMLRINGFKNVHLQYE